MQARFMESKALGKSYDSFFLMIFKFLDNDESKSKDVERPSPKPF